MSFPRLIDNNFKPCALDLPIVEVILTRLPKTVQVIFKAIFFFKISTLKYINSYFYSNLVFQANEGQLLWTFFLHVFTMVLWLKLTAASAWRLYDSSNAVTALPRKIDFHEVKLELKWVLFSKSSPWEIKFYYGRATILSFIEHFGISIKTLISFYVKKFILTQFLKKGL